MRIANERPEERIRLRPIRGELWSFYIAKNDMLWLRCEILRDLSTDFASSPRSRSCTNLERRVPPMAIEDRGFASMERSKQREIASKGGKAAHRKGAAHEWTREEAQAAGRKGGLARHRNNLQRPATSAAPGTSIQSAPLIDDQLSQ
jgi:general stress protein YciG